MICDYCGKEKNTRKIIVAMLREVNICPECENMRGGINKRNKWVDKKKSKFKISVGGRKIEIL